MERSIPSATKSAKRKTRGNALETSTAIGTVSTNTSVAHNFLTGGGEMGRLMRAFDWSRTRLGPVSTWPQSLKTAIRIILNSRYPMFVWWGPQLINLYNDAYIPMLGARHPAALGMFSSEVWKEIWHIVGPQTEIVLREGGATWNDEVLLLMERNNFTEEAYFTFSYGPLADDDGNVKGVFCAVTEETLRVLSRRRLQTLRDLGERALRESRSVEQACRTAAETLAENDKDLPFALMYLLDQDGKSAKLREAVGIGAGTAVAPGQISTNQASDIWNFGGILATDQPQLIENLDHRFGRVPAGAWSDDSTRRAFVAPLAKAGAHDSPAGFLVAGISPRLAFDHEYRGFLELVAGHIATAIANARAYEEERKRAAALAEIDRAKTAFFSNVSHEFRTPLTLMLGPLEETLAQPDGLPPENRERLEVAHRNSLRLLKLVNSLLDFSRIEADRIQATYEPTDLAAFTAELASVFRSAMEKAGLKLIVDCPPLGESVYVDCEMWEKIIFNLLSNAFKFTFEGEIEVKLEREGDHAKLIVRDTGTGIPSHELPRVFERFHRIKDARGRTFEGSGIGLALVQELVKLHGGTVNAASEMDRGSTFTVKVPLGKAHLSADRIGAARTLTSTSPRGEAYVEEALQWLPEGISEPDISITSRIKTPAAIDASVIENRRPRILLADDNADMRNYVRRLLSAKYEVTAVNDGLAAVEAAKAQPFDLVLADVMMPRLDGLGLLRALRENSSAPSTWPVILLSARAGEEARVEGMQAGADDYFVKPFSARELLARVATHLNLAQRRKVSEERLRQNSEQLQAALRVSSLGTWRWDLERNLVGIDDAMREVLGMAPLDASIPPERFVQLMHPDDQARLADYVEQIRRERRQVDVEFRILYPGGKSDGEVRWLLSRGSPVTGDGTEIKAIFGAAVDITERKRAEEALRESELRYRNLFESMDEGYCIIEMIFDRPGAERAVDYRFIEVNPAFEAQAGMRDATGKRMLQFVPSIEEHWLANYSKVALTGQPVRFANEYKTLNRWFDVYAFRVGQPEDRRVAVLFTDITARMRTEEARARLAALVESSDDAIISKDLNGVITSWNGGAARLFGYTAQQAVGQSVTILMPPERVDEEPGILERVRRGESIEHYETVRRRKDGKLLDISLTVSPVRDSQGRVIGASKIARDITERRRAESLLESERKVLELIAAGASLSKVLELLVLEVEANSGEGMLCSVLLVDSAGECLLHGAAPSLPDAYNEAIHGIRIGPSVGSCGTAAFEHRPIFVTDIAKDPLWANFKELAHVHGLGACCSTPILSSAGELLGTLAMYYRRPHDPSAHDRHLIERATQLAAIVIGRKRADEALRLAGERFRFMAESMPQKMFTAKPNGDVDYFNQQWTEFTGLSFEQIRDWGWLQFIHPDDVDENIRRWKHAIDTGELFELEHRFRRKDGVYHWHLSRAHAMRDSQGKVLMWIGSNTDIEDQKQAEEALRRSEKLAAVGRMAATMAHEVNNPLESVTNLLYLARRDANVSPQTRQHLLLADQELDRVAHITKQTLGFYRDSAAPALVDVSQTINDLLEVYGYRFRNREISLDRELDASAKIVTSAGELRQVFSNLFINAVDATPAGGRIRIRVRPSRDWNGSGRKGVRITVADTGCGIDPAHRSRIFDAFYTTKQEVGTGLGLWLSRSIVQKHGGHIQMHSRTSSGNSGTVFSVLWPDQSSADNFTLGETA